MARRLSTRMIPLSIRESIVNYSTLASNSAIGSGSNQLAAGNHNHDSDYVEFTDYATSTTGGTVKARLSGSTLYLTTNGNNA
jgi:hypothetical protein